MALLVSLSLACGASSRKAVGECDGDADADGDVRYEACPEIGLSCSNSTQIDAVLLEVCAVSSAVAQAAWEVDLAARRICNALAIADCDGDLGAVVANVNAELAARFEFAEVLEVRLGPGRCAANADAARSIADWCEGRGDPASVELSCEGLCSGACSGECTGDLSCDVAAHGLSCEGACEGACDLSVGASCEGVCIGACDAGCSCTNAYGECRGRCDGDCAGVCRTDVAIACPGTCSGRCLVHPGSASCTGGALCCGNCNGACAGECDGVPRPTDASVECQTASAIEGVVRGTCTTADVEIDFMPSGASGNGDRAALVAAVAAIDLHYPAILSAFERLDRLLATVEDLSGSIAGLADTDVDLDADVLVCLIEQLPAALDLLADAAARITATVSATAALSA